MDFTSFLRLVPKIEKETLPGADAHERMAPLERARMMKAFDPATTQTRKAAVMMLVYPKEEVAHFVLIVRNTYPGVHSSQVAFPGGKREDSDADFEATALRETFEEVGVPSHAIRVVRKFSEIYIPPSNFLVHPFLGYCTDRPDFLADPAEVAEVLEVPLAVLLDPATMEVAQMDTSYSNAIPVPGFRISGRMVWGATAMMLAELREVLEVVRRDAGFS
ncbi:MULTISPECIES: CoA pyrophosphatase [unclassified Flavobacterium]|uniref:NUDIX hydrolase n=1 Tax=unclassified Flavobacterium TaxID=196869 RepID=UPI001F148FFE|nr:MULTISPECIES: CoA pyrophosphatase [unclassified Flavobacterium]UMY65489.1 CoA pyrophosphatase [Flavobacterium sp. HJ-32-4]